MNPPEPKPRLLFHPAGTAIIYAARERVWVWELAHGELIFTCPGGLIGLARDGATLLTAQSGERYQAWETTTGREIAIGALDPQTYDFHCRAVVRPPTQTNSTTLEIVDLLGGYPAQRIDVGSRWVAPEKWSGPTGQEYLEGWLLLPNRRLAAFLWGVAGFDHTQGKVFDLDSDQKIGTFSIDQPNPTLLVAAQHNLLVSASTLVAMIYDLAEFTAELPDFAHTLSTMTWQWRYASDEGDCTCLSVHPQQPNEFAVVEKRTGFADTIQVLEAAPPARARLQGGTYSLAETGAVTALAHHPDGQRLAALLNDDAIHLWNMATRTLERQLFTSPERAQRQPDRRSEHAIKTQWLRQPQRTQLVFTATDVLLHETGQAVQAWDVHSGALKYRLPGALVGVSRDGTVVLTLEAGAGRAWSSASGASIPLESLDADSFDLAQRLVLTGRVSPAAVYAWDVLGVEPAKTFFPLSRHYLLESWLIDPGGQYVCMAMLGADEDAHLEVWDWATGLHHAMLPRIASATDVRFSSPPRRLALRFRDMNIYDLSTGKRTEELPWEWRQAFVFHPRQPWLCAYAASGAICWGMIGRDQPDRELPASLPVGALVRYLACSPGGDTVAALLENNTIQLWAIATSTLQWSTAAA